MDNESGPLAVECEFFAALLAGNVEALDRVLADDFTLIDVMRGAEISKADLLAVVAAGMAKFEVIEPAESRVRLYQNAAVITGRTKMSMRFGETPVSVNSRYTHVFVQEQTRWRMVAAQGTPIASG